MNKKSFNENNRNIIEVIETPQYEKYMFLILICNHCQSLLKPAMLLKFVTEFFDDLTLSRYSSLLYTFRNHPNSTTMAFHHAFPAQLKSSSSSIAFDLETPHLFHAITIAT